MECQSTLGSHSGGPSQGFSLVMIEYTLAPSARMDQIVGEARRAVAWVINMKTAKALGLTIPSLPLPSGSEAV
jgi:hypothetical protein